MTHEWAERYDNVFFASMHPGWADTPAVRTSMPDFYEKMKNKLIQANGSVQDINEIPADLMVEVRPRARITQAVHRPEPMQKVKRRIDDGEGGIRVGQRVTHKKFGEGVVLDQEGNGRSARVQVKFEGSGSKWLVLAYANLTVLA